MRRKSVLLSLILVLLCSVSLAACFGVKVKLYFKVDGVVYDVIDTNGHEAVAIPRDPVKDGYIFDGWYWDEGTWLKPFTTNSLLDAPIKENMSVYAKFRGENEPETPINPVLGGTMASYSIEYYLENLENSDYTLADRFVLQAKIGSEAVAYESSYYGFSVSDASASSGIVASDGSLVLKVYFKRNVYTVTFNGAGGTLKSGEEVQSVKYLGSATAPVYEYSRKEFVGFDRSYNNVTQNVTVTAIWGDSNKKDYDMSGVSFKDLTVDYDGVSHSIYATNLPAGVTVTYENNGKSEAGSYIVTAKFSGDTSSYNPIPDRTAVLTINKIKVDVSNIIFLDKEVVFDGEPKYITAKNIPSEIEGGVSYLYYKDGDEVEEAVSAGEYLVIMVVAPSKNYENISNKSATLTITRTSYKEKFEQYVELGKTVDLINADKIEVLSGGGKVFKDDLYYHNVDEINIGTQVGVGESSSKLVDALDKISASYEMKISAGSRKDKNGKFMTNKLPSVSVASDGSFTKKESSKTKEYAYNYTYTMNAYRREITGYKDFSNFEEIISDELIADAKKVRSGKMTPSEFVGIWGTHVIMSAIYGETVEVSYQAVDNSDINESEWRAKIEADIDARLGKTGINVEVGVETSGIKTRTTESSASLLEIKANSKKPFAVIGDMNNLASEYSKWMNRTGDSNDYTTLIDVPDNSLYCVWYLLGDDYQDVIDILDEYMYDNCSDLYAKKIKDFNTFMISDDVEFNSKTGTLSINLSSYQEKSENLSSFDGEAFNGVYNITPYYQGNPIKSIDVNGLYYTRDINGQIIKTMVKPFSIKFDKDWDTDINITLNNVGVELNGKNGFLDISEVTKNVAVNLTYNGVNEIIAQKGESLAALSVKTLNITSSDDSSSLTLRGGQGNDGENNKGAPGLSGGSALIATNIDINIQGCLYAYGGNGGNGSKGITPGRSDDSSAHSGGEGGKGGNGICAQSVTISGSAMLEAHGGTGGHGGNGGNAVNFGWGSKRQSGYGGKGGNGGYGLSNSGNAAATLKITGGAKVSFYGGNGANGGDSGFWDERYKNGSSGGSGAGGDKGLAYSDASTTGWKITGTISSSKNGEAGKAGGHKGSWHSQDDYYKSAYWGQHWGQ